MFAEAEKMFQNILIDLEGLIHMRNNRQKTEYVSIDFVYSSYHLFCI